MNVFFIILDAYFIKQIHNTNLRSLSDLLFTDIIGGPNAFRFYILNCE
jgi:hypothetical protein